MNAGRASRGAAAALVGVVLAVAPARPAGLPNIDDLVTEALAVWEVPGAAVTAVALASSPLATRSRSRATRSRSSPISTAARIEGSASNATVVRRASTRASS